VLKQGFETLGEREFKIAQAIAIGMF